MCLQPHQYSQQATQRLSHRPVIHFDASTSSSNMATPINQATLPERPGYHRKQSSKSILFKALVSPVKGRPKERQTEYVQNEIEPLQLPLLPFERERGQRGRALNQLEGNVKTPPRARSCHARSVAIREGQDVKDLAIRSHTQTVLEGSPEKRVHKIMESKDKENSTPRTSVDLGSFSSKVSIEQSKETRISQPVDAVSPRKISNSSADTASPKKSLSIMKRGARVMAAVAAIQGKSIPISPVKEVEVLEPTEIEARFEAMLDNRNIAPAMKEKMRNLTLRMKMDLVKQEHEVALARPSTDEEVIDETDESRSTKRSRPRSRTFTFSRSERQADGSPSKKQRGRSRSRPAPIRTTAEVVESIKSPSTPRRSSARGSRTENPADYITYLTNETNPTRVEVGRLHKLRILLRNETVAWVDSFVSLDGLTQITNLLHRIMAMEWREDHEDQLLHETLLCLKGLCTTENALIELSKLADTLFPALLNMLFDDEKKGPAEYTTRAVIINVLFAYVSLRARDAPLDLEHRASKMLSYLSKTKSQDDKQPLEFVLDMQISRPYKLWCREVTNVTREVFWIFLHQLNVIPKPRSDLEDHALETTYVDRHFPGIRPPVPAAPYIGGVEWDATTYITAHLDLLNGLVASLPTSEARNSLRSELKASGFEKTMGGTLRTCKEKFYAGIHDSLRAWVAAAIEDGWPTLFVCEGPSLEEQVKSARSSPKKGKSQPAPNLDEIKLDVPKLDLNLGNLTNNDNDMNSWLDA